jgi:hypothetical protein
MKSKAFIFREIGDLLKSNRGFCDLEVEAWKDANTNTSIRELLEFKKRISEDKEFADISCMRWFREDEQE